MRVTGAPAGAGASRVQNLHKALGIDRGSFYAFVEWALSEQLVETLARASYINSSFFLHADALRRFRDRLRERSCRDWSTHDLELLFGAVKAKAGKHHREAISYGEYLKLLWTTPHQCAKCGRAPPEVLLHIDHVVPTSLGGQSKRSNLQFLCASCNLKKSNRLEGGVPWLDLR